jgi:hypothetical protein
MISFSLYVFEMRCLRKRQSCPRAYVIKHYAVKAYGGVDVQIHIFLTSAVVGREFTVSSTGRFTPGERAAGTHCIGGRVGPRDGLNDVEKIKFLTLTGLELRSLGRPERNQLLYRLRYPGSGAYVYVLSKVKICYLQV